MKDSQKNIRTFILSNRRTTLHIEHNQCQLPFVFGDGWQIINLDLHDILERCFGTQLISTQEIIIYGSVRIGKIYFQDKLYSDVELPPYLRLMSVAP
jgi:hypothetical protein